MQKPKLELHDYWRTSQQDPWSYAQANPKRSKRLLRLVRHYVEPGKILEIGTNAGRNLHYLHRAGRRDLEGIEISPDAVATMRQAYPHLSDVPVRVGTVEEIIGEYGDKVFSCAFTMAVLEHLHFDSEWVFAEIARIAGVVITVEDEQCTSERHFPRNYEEVFTRLGMEQVHAEECSSWGLSPSFMARVFRTT